MIDYSDRKGDWIGTYSGLRFYPQDPRPEDISIVDIACALAAMPRFGGHTGGQRYSVADHSMSCALRAPRGFKLDALMHDASEAYLMDLPRPLKRMLPDYAAMERRAQAVIALKFGLYLTMPDMVKAIDNEVLVAEATAFMKPDESGEAPWWTDTTKWPDLSKLAPMFLVIADSATAAFAAFLKYWVRESCARHGERFTASLCPGFDMSVLA